RLSLLFPDTYNGQPRRLLDAVLREAGHYPVIGAGSSENGTQGATYQMSGDLVLSNSVSGLHLWGGFNVHVDVTQGCQPITKPMTITRSLQNVIFEIDRRPAFQVFTGLLKGPLLEDLRRALAYVFVGLPPSRERGEIEQGRYLVRNIVGLDPARGTVAIAETPREGDTIVFALRDGPRAREDLIQMLDRQAARLDCKRPAFGFYFNCCARGASLYGFPGIDTAYIQRRFGDFPLVGMFGGYELAPLGAANHLFAYTGVLALVTEQDAS
ncbi:MAG TPA: FIST N-terminal domain-containing protein, partial [candidate division Zixibacteria bacterium]|nr:FIST N-terminal domain-containing protein [candidate division Zixibacteria bacterium]